LDELSCRDLRGERRGWHGGRKDEERYEEKWSKGSGLGNMFGEGKIEMKVGVSKE
jgi:hypothetical protein